MTLNADQQVEALAQMGRVYVRRGDEITIVKGGPMPSEAEMESALAERGDRQAQADQRRIDRAEARTKLKNPAGVTNVRELASILDKLLPDEPGA